MLLFLLWRSCSPAHSSKWANQHSQSTKDAHCSQIPLAVSTTSYISFPPFIIPVQKVYSDSGPSLAGNIIDHATAIKLKIPFCTLNFAQDQQCQQWPNRKGENKILHQASVIMHQLHHGHNTEPNYCGNRMTTLT